MAITDWIAPIAGAAASLFNTGSQNLGNKKNWKHTKDLFDMTNAYNAPVQQVQRMKSAGINPALMYNGTVQNTSSQPNTPKYEAPQIPETLMADLALKVAQKNLTVAQTPTTAVNINLGDANVLNKKADTDFKNQATETQKQTAMKIATETARIQQDYNLNKDLFDTNVQYRQEQLKKLQNDNLALEKTISTYDEKTQAQIAQLKQSYLESVQRTKNLENQNWIQENDKQLRELYVNPNGSNIVDTVLRYLVGNGSNLLQSQKK